MDVSRRKALTIGIGGTAFASTMASAEPGIRIARHGEPQRPAIAVFLPDVESPSAVIEMPEHAWRKEKPGDEPQWFYKMYGSDPSLRGRVEWSNTAAALSFAMQTPSGFELRSTATAEADGVSIVHEVLHEAVPALAAIEAVTCVKLYRPFTDVFLDRTFVHRPEGLELIASDAPGRSGKNAEEWLPCRYIARVGKNAPAQPYRAEKEGGVTRHFKSSAADVAFLATESSPAGWTAATFARDCDSVFTNPARTCHHADPVAKNATGGRTRLRLKVFFVRGTATEAWRHVARAERLS